MEKKEKINGLLAEHLDWQERLAGFKKDLNRLSSDLGIFLLKKEPREIPSEAEHFQNQFILQLEVLDILRHDMKQYENTLEANLEKPDSDSVDDLMAARESLNSRLNDFIRLFNELCSEYGSFKSEEAVAF